jgi:Ca2+/Na+ antiporter
LVLGLVLPIALIVILYAIGVPIFILNILVVIAVAYVYAVFLYILFNLSNKKRKYERNKTLYEWMDDLDDYNEHLVYSFRSINNKRDPIENLNIIKEVIVRQSNKDPRKLKLYKVYYNNLAKESADELYFKTALAILSSIGILILKEFINTLTKVNISSGLLIALLVFITIAVVAKQITDNKKRTGLLVDILDLIIEEVEKNPLKKEA